MRHTLAGAACALLLAAGLLATGRQPRPAAPPRATPPAAPAATGPRFVVAPLLQMATPTTVTVVWETSFPGSSRVRYGVGAPTRTQDGADAVTLHEVTLTGLAPGQPHVYQVTTEGPAGQVVSPLLTCQPAVGPDDAFSFVLFGDTQKNPRMTEKIATLAWQRRPNFAIHLGDVVDNGPDPREWTDELFGPCRELFGRVPVYPCLGNHEKNHAHYYRYFALPAPEYHYRYRYGNADFFVLDTNRRVGPSSEQYRWLDAELGRSTATWKFVYHHHPAYSSDENDWGDTWKGAASKQGDPNVRQLVALYEKYNVDVVFNGHIHLYERTWPLRGGKVDRSRGVVYVTSGGGGGKLENIAPVPTFFKAQSRSDYHYGYVTIHGGKLCFKAFDHQGMLFDSFDLERR